MPGMVEGSESGEGDFAAAFHRVLAEVGSEGEVGGLLHLHRLVSKHSLARPHPAALQMAALLAEVHSTCR